MATSRKGKGVRTLDRRKDVILNKGRVQIHSGGGCCSGRMYYASLASPTS